MPGHPRYKGNLPSKQGALSCHADPLPLLEPCGRLPLRKQVVYERIQLSALIPNAEEARPKQ